MDIFVSLILYKRGIHPPREQFVGCSRTENRSYCYDSTFPCQHDDRTVWKA